MKTKLIVLAISSLAILASCTGKKTTPNAADNDSANVVDTTASNKDNVDLASVAGTYVIIALKQYRLYHSNDTASLAWLQVSLFTWLAIPV